MGKRPLTWVGAILFRDEMMTGAGSSDQIQGFACDDVRADSPVVRCDGQNPDANLTDCSGHPLVYLAMGEEGRATCPYCSRRFVLGKQTETINENSKGKVC